MKTESSGKVVMLIDDDAVTNMINTKVIKRNFNFEVIDYADAQLALEHLRDWSHSSPEKLPFMIFLDINMPIMDGWEFLAAFQELPDVVLETARIFMLTSSIDVDDIEKAKTFHVVKDFVSKPLNHEKLTSLIV